MKTYIYTPGEIAALREGGAILGRILGELVEMVKPGMTTGELDAHAEKRMREAGGEPSFKGYKAGGSVPFPGTVCTSINDEVVHAPPVPSRAVKAGDVISLDIGLRYKGLCTDMAVTVPVGSVPEETMRLLRVTRDSLFEGIEGIKPGALIGDIGKNVQKVVEADGFGVVRDLVGHGVGHHVHEGPSIPNFEDDTMPKVVIKKGMVLAVEPMVNAGDYDVKLHPNAWTIMTADGTLSAHFEVTLAVTAEGHEVLTPLPKVPGL